MAAPKVFISSTCFDLKEVRDSLNRFVKGFGFDPVLSEHGDVFYHPDLHTHESCLHELTNCQMFILIIGGRFGGSYVNDKERSITNAEYEAARECKLPIFAYIKRGVLESYNFYRINKDKPFVSEAEFMSIDNQENAVDIFNFIDQVKKYPVGNGYETFETSNEIEIHLRKQWAGMFFDFLKNREVKEQINVANVMISALQTSSDKLEEIIKGLYVPESKEKSSEFLDNLDSKYAAITFFELVLDKKSSNFTAYIGNYDQLDSLAQVEPKGSTWDEYLIKLGCYAPTVYELNDNGDECPGINFVGPGEPSFSGFSLEPGEKFHQDKQMFYEQGVKRLDLEQRKNVLSKFVQMTEGNISPV